MNIRVNVLMSKIMHIPINVSVGTYMVYNIVKSWNRKTIHSFFSINDTFKNTATSKWEIQMDWENGI